MRYADRVLDDFGVMQNYDLRDRFPLDEYYRTIHNDWDQFRKTDVFDGNAVEFQVLSTFDMFQRRYLQNAFGSHPALRPFRLASSHSSIMPPDITPIASRRSQFVLGNYTGLSNAPTVQLPIPIDYPSSQ